MGDDAIRKEIAEHDKKDQARLKTEEIKALREFTHTHPNTYGDWLEGVVEELKFGSCMMGVYSQQAQDLLRVLHEFGVLEVPYGESEIKWTRKLPGRPLKASRIYRINSDYELPELLNPQG